MCHSKTGNKIVFINKSTYWVRKWGVFFHCTYIVLFLVKLLTMAEVQLEGGGARAPPEFGKSVNPVQTMGGRLCPSHYCQPPGFKMLSTPLLYFDLFYRNRKGQDISQLSKSVTQKFYKDIQPYATQGNQVCIHGAFLKEYQVSLIFTFRKTLCSILFLSLSTEPWLRI